MPCIYHRFDKVVKSGRVLTLEQVEKVSDLSITPDRTQAQGEDGPIVVPANTWLARVGDKWFLVPRELKKEIRALGVFNFGKD